MLSKMGAYLCSRWLLSQRLRLSYSVGVRTMLLELFPHRPGVKGEGDGEWMGEPYPMTMGLKSGMGAPMGRGILYDTSPMGVVLPDWMGGGEEVTA